MDKGASRGSGSRGLKTIGADGGMDVEEGGVLGCAKNGKAMSK